MAPWPNIFIDGEYPRSNLLRESIQVLTTTTLHTSIGMTCRYHTTRSIDPIDSCLRLLYPSRLRDFDDRRCIQFTYAFLNFLSESGKRYHKLPPPLDSHFLVFRSGAGECGDVLVTLPSQSADETSYQSLSSKPAGDILLDVHAESLGAQACQESCIPRYARISTSTNSS